MKVVPYGVDHLEYYNGSWKTSDIEMRSSLADRICRDYVDLPCGKCIGCRIQYSREWANRLMLELQYHRSAYFCTFTYNDEHIPTRYYGDPDCGEAVRCDTLYKRDLQKLFKRLRKSGQDIRYFACGEYGSTTFRPHYHAIIFGLELSDLQPYGKSVHGFQYYTSATLERAWSFLSEESEGDCPGIIPRPAGLLGYCVVAPVSWETCAYTARYVTKKLDGPEAQFYDDHNIEPPFSIMSRRPGLAHQYYVDHPEWKDSDFLYVSSPDRGLKFRPPGYFERLYDIEYPEESEERKLRRSELAQQAKALKLAGSSKSYAEMLLDEEANLNARISKLDRNKI